MGLGLANRHHKVMCVVRRREGGREVGGIRLSRQTKYLPSTYNAG